jgi:hypothetical protein
MWNMNADLAELGQKYLRGQIEQDKFLPAVIAMLEAKHKQLTVIRDGEVTDFAKKLSYFA